MMIHDREAARSAGRDAGPDGAGAGPIRECESLWHLRELPREEGSKSCLENPDEPETKKKKAVKRSPAQRKKPALQTPFLPAQRGYGSDESSALGWVVDVPAWDADEAARLEGEGRFVR